MNTRKTLFRMLLVSGLGACALALAAQLSWGEAAPGAGPAPAPPPASAAPLTELQVVEKVTKATDHALDYLERIQVSQEGAENGSWSSSYQAINAMAMLAFMSKGHVPGRGKYGDVLTRAKKYILSKAQPTGYLALGGRMYDHGMATLALAELYGMDPDEDGELEAKLRKAVDLILRSQGKVKLQTKPGAKDRFSGGWNYEPRAVNGDLSVSVMQIVALRAANNAGIPVPEEAIERAINYVKGMANPGGPGFGYNGPSAGSVQTSAAGCLSLQLLGNPNDPQIAKTLDYLAPTKVAWKGGGANYFYYFHYYAIQAFYQGGGKNWNKWHPQVREMLLDKQNKQGGSPDYGSWDVPPGTSEAGYVGQANKAYSTALATLVLNIYLHYLPAYQR